MKQEATDKFLGIKEEGLCLITVFAISVAQGDLSVFDSEDAVIGQSHTMGVAAEVIEDSLWRAERLFRVDDPVRFPQCFGFIVGRRELSSLIGLLQQSQKLSTKHPA